MFQSSYPYIWYTKPLVQKKIRPWYYSSWSEDWNYSKTCLKRPLKKDKTKVLMENGSLMKVKSIAECSPWSILQYFWPALSDNRSRKPIFGLLFQWPLKTDFTAMCWHYYILLYKSFYWICYLIYFWDTLTCALEWDPHVHNVHLGRYIIGFTVTNNILEIHWWVVIKLICTSKTNIIQVPL